MSISMTNLAGFIRESTEWSLVGQLGTGEKQTIELQSFPFQVGRREGMSLTLRSNTISKCHAEFTLEDGVLYLRDLNSTNGTFVNGVRIRDRVALNGNDLIQFERMEFQLRKRIPHESCATMCYEGVIATSYELRRILAERAIVPHFQPIVRLDTGDVMGYEVLVRAKQDGLLSPAVLFDSAERAGLEFELSNLARKEGVRIGATLGHQTMLFVNTHPAELSRPELIPALERLRKKNPKSRLVLEIHESAVCDHHVMRTLTQALHDLDIELAYDDFGQGQSRLVELMDLPPQYLKFDMQLIRGIDTASEPRRRMLESLVRMTAELGAKPLAEGIETPGELMACTDLGFQLAQGYLCGRPMTAKQILTDQIRDDFGATSMSRREQAVEQVPEFVS